MNNFKKINDEKLGKKLSEKMDEIGLKIPVCNLRVSFGPLGMEISGGIHEFGAGFMCHEYGVAEEDFHALYHETFEKAATNFSEKFANLAKNPGVIVDGSKSFGGSPKEDEVCN